MSVDNTNLVNASLVAKLTGYVIQYFACGLLVPAVLLCFAALVFCQIALFGPNIGWLGHLLAWMPASVRTALAGTTIKADNHVDIGALVMRIFWILSLILMGLEMLGRGLRGALTRKPSVVTAPASAGMPRRWSLRAMAALALVTLIFAGAFFAVPHARMAAGSSHADMYTVFAVLYVFAAGFALAYATLSGLAERLIDGAPQPAMQRAAML